MKKSTLTTATVATLLLLIGSARAVDFPDMPPMKEGLWKIHNITADKGKPPDDTTLTLCRDHVYDNGARAAAKKMLDKCTSISDTKLLGKRTITMSCTIGGSKIVTKSTLVAASDTHYRSESTTTYDPPFYGQTQTSMVQEQTYMGACPAGMSPGDRMTADGKIQKHH